MEGFSLQVSLMRLVCVTLVGRDAPLDIPISNMVFFPLVTCPWPTPFAALPRSVHGLLLTELPHLAVC